MGTESRDDLMYREHLSYHRSVGYTFVPSIRARVSHEAGGYLIRTNGAGFRSDWELNAPVPDHSHRIFLFGDSFVAGDGVSNDRRWGNLLENRMPSLRVDNFGLPGSAPDQHWLAYKSFAVERRHDLLVIAVHIGNIHRLRARFRLWRGEGDRVFVQARPHFELVNGELLLRNHPVPQKRWTYEEWCAAHPPPVRSASSKAPHIDVKDPYPEYAKEDHPNWRLLRAILERWIEGATAPVLLMPLPDYRHIEGRADPEAYQTRFKHLAHRTGCALFDPLPDLMGYSHEDRRLFRFKTDTHYTPEGHAALAAATAPRLAELLAWRQNTR